MTVHAKHQVLIIGGGTAGITVAARLLRKGFTDVAVIEPSDKHYYQPMWTLVGGGQASAASTERPEASVMPKAATWIRQAAAAVDPEANTVSCEDGSAYEYDVLVVCPGIQLDWDKTDGLTEALGNTSVSSNYRYDLAPKTWDLIRRTRSGSAVFMMPSGPMKCAGAPQKIAYLAADYWRKEGVLKDIDVHLVVPTPRAFGIPAIADSLDRVIAGYGIHLHTLSEVTAVDVDSRKVNVSAVGRAAPTAHCPSTCCTRCHGSPRRTGSRPVRCPPVSPPGTSRSTSTPCSTSAIRTCLPLVMPGRHRTPRPGPPSADRHPRWWRTSGRS